MPAKRTLQGSKRLVRGKWPQALEKEKRNSLERVARLLEHKARQLFTWEEMVRETRLVLKKHPFNHANGELAPEGAKEEMAHYFIMKLAQSRLSQKEMSSLKLMAALVRERHIGLSQQAAQERIGKAMKETGKYSFVSLRPKIQQMIALISSGRAWPKSGSRDAQKEMSNSDQSYELWHIQKYGREKMLETLGEMSREIKECQRHWQRQNRK